MNTTTIYCSICGYHHTDGKPVMVAGTYCDAIQATEAITTDQWLESLEPTKADEVHTPVMNPTTGVIKIVSKDRFFAQPVDANGLPVLKYDGPGFTDYDRDTEIDYVSADDELAKIERWVDKNPTESASVIDGSTLTHDQMLKVLKHTDLPQTFERDERSVVLDGSDGFIATKVYDPEVTERFAFKLLNAYRNNRGGLTVGNVHINYTSNAVEAFCSRCNQKIVSLKQDLDTIGQRAGREALQEARERNYDRLTRAVANRSGRRKQAARYARTKAEFDRACQEITTKFRIEYSPLEPERENEIYNEAYLKAKLDKAREFTYRVIAHGNNHGPEWLTKRDSFYIMNPLVPKEESESESVVV